MSVVMVRAGRDPSEVLIGHEGFGLVSIPTDSIAAAGLEVRPEPVDGEPDHAVVVGPKSQGTSRALSRASTWIVRPPGAHPTDPDDPYDP